MDEQLIKETETKAVFSLATLVDAFEAYPTASEAAEAILVQLEKMDLADTRSALVLAAQKLHELLPSEMEATNENCSTPGELEDVSNLQS